MAPFSKNQAFLGATGVSCMCLTTLCHSSDISPKEDASAQCSQMAGGLVSCTFPQIPKWHQGLWQHYIEHDTDCSFTPMHYRNPSTRPPCIWTGLTDFTHGNTCRLSFLQTLTYKEGYRGLKIVKNSFLTLGGYCNPVSVNERKGNAHFAFMDLLLSIPWNSGSRWVLPLLCFSAACSLQNSQIPFPFFKDPGETFSMGIQFTETGCDGNFLVLFYPSRFI